MGSGLVDQLWKPYPDVPADVVMIVGMGLLWDLVTASERLRLNLRVGSSG